MGQLFVQNISDSEWTPGRVGDEIIWAVRWSFYTGGRVGPAGYSSGLPEIVMEFWDRLAESWDIVADQEAIPKRRKLSPEEVSRAERVLLWQSQYLRETPVIAGALALWVACKVRRISYQDMLMDFDIPRATAYRRVNSALAKIAKGLTADGIKRGKH